MIDTEKILKKLNDLVDKHGTKNPRLLAKYEGIIIIERPYKKQMGAFAVVNKIPFVFIKEDLDELEKNKIISHELGHYILHKNNLKDIAILRDFSLFKKQENIMEMEANFFMENLLND